MLAILCGLFAVQTAAAADDSISRLEPLLAKYCIKCHGTQEPEAGVNLEGRIHHRRMLKDQSTWRHVKEQIESEEMPPKKPYPTKEERDLMVATIDRAINQVDWTELHDPGRTTLARLTKIEYRNAIRDVFGVDLQAGRFLTDDPEGNSGFTNDRESLSFPLFAFDDFLREAERAADSVLAFAEAPWSWAMELEEDARRSTITTTPTPSGDGVALKDPNVPHQISIAAPFTGLYEITLHAYTFQGEPISGMGLFVDGAPVQDWVIKGTNSHPIRTRVNLSAGAHTVVFGYNGDLAPIIQDKIIPRSVPVRIQREITKRPVVEYPLPGRFRGNKEAEKAWARMNSVITAYHFTGELAKLLRERGQTDYEKHTMTHPKVGDVLQSRVINTFQPGKVALNLSAGKVAVLLGIPQKKLEQQIKQKLGFSHQAYVKAVNAYRKAFREKHPDRVRKKPGRIGLDRIEIASHALDAGEAKPSFLLHGLSSEAAAQVALKELATRAYSRPPRSAELANLGRLYRLTFAQTKSRREALRDAIAGLLVSPPFLLRYAEGPAAKSYAVDEVELARRLSHFLWLSIPDEQLRKLAGNGKLSQSETLLAEVDRMIADPKFEAFAKAFTSEWLDLASLSRSDSLNASLRLAMEQEPGMFVRDLFRHNRPLTDLVKAPYAYVNAKLAHHYGLPAVTGDSLRRVAVTTDRRGGGLLTMGAPLVSTSTDERTSPVNRGVWIVELLLGEHLPPAPASVPELKTGNKAGTIREELERHRQAAACAGCHSKIDPYGFVLEHYDPIGAWRTRDKGKPVDASTILDDGTKVNGLTEFQNYLLAQRTEDLTRNLTKRLLAFALGREIRYTDEATVRSIVQQAQSKGLAARALIHQIVLSEAFRMQNNSNEAQ